MRSFIHVAGQLMRRLDFSKSIISMDVLKVMATGIARLDALTFSSCGKLTSEHVHAFISCCNTSLTTLDLSNCALLNDDALGWIAGTLGPQGSLTQCTRLLSLDVSHSKSITDRGLAALGIGCKALQFVNLEGLERIGSAGILSLIQGCKMLRVLSLKKCMQLNDTALVHIGKHGAQIRSLNLSSCYNLSSKGLLAMVPGTSLLQSLNLEGCLNMREDILAAVATSCLSLQVLNLNGCQEITENGISTLADNLPFVQKATRYRGLEPKTDGLQLKFAVQQKTICNSAALRIQALYRGYRGRTIAASWRVVMIDLPARRKIIRNYRSWTLNREIERRVKRRKLEFISAIKIQSLARGVQCRAALERDRIEDERIKLWSKYAVKVQAAYRSHWTRRHWKLVFKTIERYRMERDLLHRQAAATRLQRGFRKRYNRTRFDELMAINQLRRHERQQAATLLQRLFRTRAARKAYRQLRAAIEEQRRQHRELIRYAIKLQSQWRGYKARRELVHAQHARQQREQRKYDAASRINAGVRGYFGRRVAQSERVTRQSRIHAARVIQRAWKYFKTPNAERIKYEQMLLLMKQRLIEEEVSSKQQQSEIMKKTRAFMDRDSASEPESDDDWRDFLDENGDQFWFSPSKNQRLYMRPNDFAREKTLLGLSCRVFWQLEQQWFTGSITRYNRSKDKHRIEYEDGDHDWLAVHLEKDRIQVYNGYSWCLLPMFEPSVRALRATIFLMLRFQQYDHRYLGWRSGYFRAYHEPSDTFLLSYDDSSEEWVDVFRNENSVQVQDAITLQWYSLSGYVFGHARGRPIASGKGSSGYDYYYYSVEDYLSYVEPVAQTEEELVESADAMMDQAEPAAEGSEQDDEGENEEDGDEEEENEEDDEDEGDDEEEDEEDDEGED